MRNNNEIRMELRLRNNILYELIFGRYPSVKAFCDDSGFSQSVVGELLNLKGNIRRSNGEYRTPAQAIAEFFGMLVEDVFPNDIYGLPQTKFEGSVSVSALSLSALNQQAITYRDPAFQEIEGGRLSDVLESVLGTIPDREAEVLRKRNGIGCQEQTLSEIASEYGISRERVRQIEAKGLRRLRHPKRSGVLKEFVGAAG